MNPQDTIQYLSNAMNLRDPQKISLELFANYLQSPAGQKLLERISTQKRISVSEILDESKAYFCSIPEAHSFQDFERSFPAYTFALATGVGKTRLMGAFVAYLYLVYNIQHFLIVAPNLTIYRKLFDDFSRTNNPKYVFKGIQEINGNYVQIVTTENYKNQKETLYANQIEINIFNVQQFAQRDMSSGKGITNPWETAGQSYFDYLKQQKDLVVLLDEAHHYHADAALSALDILDPSFALEMTATPYIGTKGSGKNLKQITMKNVLYAYNLGDAIRGKLVKDPWIGTEADVDFSQFDPNTIDADARKIQLALYFHERAKFALKEYAVENNKPLIKPVLLVVAKDTDHAKELRKLIDNESFRGGEFKGRVLEIHTKLSGEESEKNIQDLISLESPNNIFEIVIHVNMLKEGWDVTNVYTILPLRESAAAILTEQTIGRGLRLPYGERTGVALVDKLIIVAHEQFSKIVELAKNSPLIQGQVEQVTAQQTKETKVFSPIDSVTIYNVKKAINNNPVIMDAVVQKVETIVANIPNIEKLGEEAKKEITNIKQAEVISELAKETINNCTFSSYHGQKTGQSTDSPQATIFGTYTADVSNELATISEKSAKELELRNIPIPRLILTPQYEELVIYDFDLVTNNLRDYTNDRAILEEQLQNTTEKNLLDEDIPGRRKSEITHIKSFGLHNGQSPENTIIAALTDCNLIDYDDPKQKPLLIKLAKQAVSHYRKKQSTRITCLSLLKVMHVQLQKISINKY